MPDEQNKGQQRQGLRLDRRRLLRLLGLAAWGSMLPPQRLLQARQGGDVMNKQSMTLFLCGDVMTGRGIDQILPHPSKPHLFEPYMRSALGYVQIAQEITLGELFLMLVQNGLKDRHKHVRNGRKLLAEQAAKLDPRPVRRKVGP